MGLYKYSKQKEYIMPKTNDEWVHKEQREFIRCKGECGDELPISHFQKRGTYPISGAIRYDSRCKKCSRTHRERNWKKRFGFKELKFNYINELKETCYKCNYSKCSAAMDFHHIDETTKVRGIAEMVNDSSVNLELLKEEVSKCVILCCRCHRELHAGLWNLENKQIG